MLSVRKHDHNAGLTAVRRDVAGDGKRSSIERMGSVSDRYL